ncbi:MAG: hypothetical protein ACI9KE_005330 [Polyangiales bacterium]|jgi:hypothetical protein
MTRLVLSALLTTFVGFSVLPASNAKAQGDERNGAEAEIASVREMILYARYDEAIAGASAILNRTGLSAVARNEALEVLATSHLANRDTESAAPILQHLYSRDPGYVLRDGDASPLVQGAFQRARENAPAPVTVTLGHTPPAPSVRQSPMVEVTVTQGITAVGEIHVHYRASGAPRFATSVMELNQSGIARARLPLMGAGNMAQTLEYYIVAYAPSRTPLAGMGDESSPMMIEVPAAGDTQSVPVPLGPEGEEIHSEGGSSKWWIALIVIGVAGAAVGGYFLFRGEEPTGSLGHITLR